MKKQKSLFEYFAEDKLAKRYGRTQYGGIKTKGRRKLERPLSTRQWIHLVLKSVKGGSLTTFIRLHVRHSYTHWLLFCEPPTLILLMSAPLQSGLVHWGASIGAFYHSSGRPRIRSPLTKHNCKHRVCRGLASQTSAAQGHAYCRPNLPPWRDPKPTRSET